MQIKHLETSLPQKGNHCPTPPAPLPLESSIMYLNVSRFSEIMGEISFSVLKFYPDETFLEIKSTCSFVRVGFQRDYYYHRNTRGSSGNTGDMLSQPADTILDCSCFQQVVFTAESTPHAMLSNFYGLFFVVWFFLRTWISDGRWDASFYRFETKGLKRSSCLPKITSLEIWHSCEV